MTIDGNCDHTILNPDVEIHEHYTNLLKESGVVLYGRNTFELMKYYPIIAGQGLQLFENIHHRIDLTHQWTKSFKSGAVIHSYNCLPKT